MKKISSILLLTCFCFSVIHADAPKDTAKTDVSIPKPVTSVKKIKSITLFNDSLNEALIGKKISVVFDPAFNESFDGSVNRQHNVD